MTTGGYYVPVVTTGRFSDAPGSIYRSILSSCRYYLEDFDYRSILVDSGTIVHWRGWTGCTMAPRTVRTSPLVRRLQSFGELQTFVVGNWGEGSEDLHAPRPNLCRGRVSRICRSSGRPEAEHLLGTIVGQYCRLISTCAVRAQAMCTLARVGLISPAAREAARRRQVAMRMEAQMKEERKAQWMASLRGPGWADATEFEPNKHSMYTCSKFHI